MKTLGIVAASFLTLLLTVAAGTPLQDGVKKLDDFEGELTGWSAIKMVENVGLAPDESSKVAITHDAQHVKQGRGALAYTYEIGPDAFRALSIQRPKDFTGMASLHFWVKCTSATAIMVGLNETGGAAFQASVYCPSGSWQEVALNIDELTLDDPKKKPEGKLDLDAVESFYLLDLGGFLVRMLPEIKGTRILWLDDVSFSSKPAPRTTGPAKSSSGAPIHLVDNFESPLIRWMPVSFEMAETPRINIFDTPLSADAEAPAGGGKQSLKATYTRQAAKACGLIRNLEKVDLKKAKGLELSLKTSQDGTYLVNIEEKSGEKYQQVVQLKAADGWKSLSWPLTAFTMAQDSKHDNDKLDADQIKEISIADLTTLFAGGAGAGVENILRIDEVRFTLGE
jgi:hypothetical protein